MFERRLKIFLLILGLAVGGLLVRAVSFRSCSAITGKARHRMS